MTRKDRAVRLRRSAQGFNLVEIMITLTLIALLTTTLINFVNDFDDKTRVAKARNDLMRLSQQALLAESRSGQLLSTSSASGSTIMTLLLEWIVELPDYDPWGNRFIIQPDGTVTRSKDEGVAYVLDPAFGRFICAGPDGVVNTELGRTQSDNDNDIVVEYRQQPWVTYAYTPNGGTGDGEIWVARGDGTGQGRVLPHPSHGSEGAINVTFSPDGSRFCGVETDGGAATGRLIWGNTTPENPAVQVVAGISVNDESYPLFAPDGNHVVVINDGRGLWLANLPFKIETELLPDGVMPLESTPDINDTNGRIVHSSRERSYYFRYGGSAVDTIAIAVANDLKVAVSVYGGGFTDGIYVILPGGQRRVLRKSGGANKQWVPLFWEDAHSLVYYAETSGNLQMRRVNQDGRFDIPLFNHTNADGSGNGLNPVPKIPSISPDGTLISWVYSGAHDGLVLRSDGGGWIKGTYPLSGYKYAASSPPIFYQEHVWALDMSRHYMAAEEGGTSGIREVDYSLDQGGVGLQENTPTANSTFEVSPARMAMSSSGLVLAVVSAPGFGGEEGVFLFPLLGPEAAKMQVSTTAPVNGNIPNIAWIRD